MLFALHTCNPYNTYQQYRQESEQLFCQDVVHKLTPCILQYYMTHHKNGVKRYTEIIDIVPNFTRAFIGEQLAAVVFRNFHYLLFFVLYH